MKRLLLMLALGASLIACNPSGGSSSSPTVDPSTAAPSDVAPSDPAVPSDSMDPSAAPSAS